MYAIFGVDRSKFSMVEEILREDIISRMSITKKDGTSIGFDEDLQYILLEGEEKVVEMAKEKFKGVGKLLEEDETEKIREKIKREEEEAASGIGLIFG